MNKYDFKTDTITYKDNVIENFFASFSQQKEMVQYVKDNLIILCVGGSHAYGMATEDSDVDIRGIFKDNIDQILGLGKIDQLANDSNDIVIYSLSKALQLIADQNPNMQELLWISKEDILYMTDDYWYLRSRRDELVSKKAKHTYSGYAMQQIRRMTNHKKMIIKEQSGKYEQKPVINDYLNYVDLNGQVTKKFNYSISLSNIFYVKIKDEFYNVWQSTSECYSTIETGNQFIPVQETYNEKDIYRGTMWFNKLQFKKDLDEYNKWKTWKNNRNTKRHELEEKYGYDCKHASHTYRLLNSGLEILNGEGVKVKRPDATFLLNIRNGKYSYEWIIEKATELDTIDMPKAYENSPLQNSVDKKIVVDMIKHIILKGE